MRIINEKNMTSLSSVLIMLTPSEAAELADYLKNLDAGTGDHVHVNDAEYRREITIAIYTDQNLHLFAKEIQNLIKSS